MSATSLYRTKVHLSSGAGDCQGREETTRTIDEPPLRSTPNPPPRRTRTAPASFSGTGISSTSQHCDHHIPLPPSKGDIDSDAANYSHHCDSFKRTAAPPSFSKTEEETIYPKNSEPKTTSTTATTKKAKKGGIKKSSVYEEIKIERHRGNQRAYRQRKQKWIKEMEGRRQALQAEEIQVRGEIERLKAERAKLLSSRPFVSLPGEALDEHPKVLELYDDADHHQVLEIPSTVASSLNLEILIDDNPLTSMTNSSSSSTLSLSSDGFGHKPSQSLGNRTDSIYTSLCCGDRTS